MQLPEPEPAPDTESSSQARYGWSFAERPFRHQFGWVALSVILLSSTTILNHVWLPLNTAFVAGAVTSLLFRFWFPERRRFRRLAFESVVVMVLLVSFFVDSRDGVQWFWLVVTFARR